MFDAITREVAMSRPSLNIPGYPRYIIYIYISKIPDNTHMYLNFHALNVLSFLLQQYTNIY